MISYWEQKSFVKYRYVVIGGGIVGISTALSLSEVDPKASILILERGIFPSGASTRNAGFACFGSITELMEDIENIGEEATRQVVADRWQGLQLLRKRIGDAAMGFENHGGFELLFHQDLNALDAVDGMNKLLHPVFKEQIYKSRPDLIPEFGFNHKQVVGMIENPLEGQLNTGKLMKFLLKLVRERGINYLTGANVKNFEKAPNNIYLNVASTASENIRFRAKRVAVCTNAFGRHLIPDLDIKPGRGLVLITKPLPDLKFQGVFHYNQGYNYFRNVANRVMIGGGRNLDIIGEQTTTFGINESILQHLKSELTNIILPGRPFEVDCSWSGIMAFGKDKRPLVGQYTPEIGYAVRLGGMGVAMGSLVGDRLARLICLDH